MSQVVFTLIMVAFLAVCFLFPGEFGYRVVRSIWHCRRFSLAVLGAFRYDRTRTGADLRR